MKTGLPAVRTALALALPALLVVGCSPNSTPVDEGPAPDSIVDFIEPIALVAAHARALTLRDFDRYAALLSADFEFAPPGDDLPDFPWITPSDPWVLADELDAIGNMMNPEFVSDRTGESVDSIRMELTPVEQVPVEGTTHVRVLCDADILVLWAPGTGAQANGRLRFTLAPDERGYLRILKIVELPPFGRRSAVERSSWGGIKALYRS